MAIKIAISNQKGGIGKTTTALSLATGLQNKKTKVLLVDTDPQRNSTRVYKAKIDDIETLADIMYEGISADKCIQKTELGDIIASDEALKTAETKIEVDTDRFYHLMDSMKSVEDDYDYIIFDTPPGNGVLLGNVLSYADYVIIPVTCDTFGIQGLHDLDKTIREYKKRINEKLKIIGILKVKYKERQNLTKDIEDNMLPLFAKEMDTIVFKTAIRESVKCQEAQSLQMSLFEYAPGSTTASDYRDFIKELKKIIKEDRG